MNTEAHVARANKLGIKLEGAIVIVLTICYVSQGAKNSISTLGLLALMVSLWIPFIIANVLTKKKPGSGAVKHFIGLGYGLFYLCVCLISDQQLVYTYAFPMLIVVAIYCDFKFAVKVGAGVCLISIIHALYFTNRAGWTAVAITALEIQIASTILVVAYSTISNKFIVKITDEQMAAINEANDKTERMLEEIVDVSNNLADEVAQVSTKMSILSASSEETLEAMKEVQSGTRDTAESVQNQLLKTEEIQKQIGKVSDVAKNISENVELTDRAIREGQDNINKLIEQASVSEKTGSDAVKEVGELKNFTDQMQEIVAMIQGVASQTSLLALNASIEAARAGEAGRGFAVVASEISNLAAQTQTATGNISSLIESVTGKMSTVADVISSLVDSNVVQNESAHVSAESFKKIVDTAGEIRTSSGALATTVDTLDSANKEIVDSIQTISGITEELTAHTENTYTTTEKNESIVATVQEIVSEMTSNAERLKSIE